MKVFLQCSGKNVRFKEEVIAHLGQHILFLRKVMNFLALLVNKPQIVRLFDFFSNFQSNQLLECQLQGNL